MRRKRDKDDENNALNCCHDHVVNFEAPRSLCERRCRESRKVVCRMPKGEQDRRSKRCGEPGGGGGRGDDLVRGEDRLGDERKRG